MNKDIFISLIFKNKIINKYIFDRVYEINRLYQDENQCYKWSTIIKSPNLMITFGYFGILKIFYDKKIKSILSKSRYNFLYGHGIQFMEAARVGRLDILKYLINIFKINERIKEDRYEKEFQTILIKAIYLIESVDYKWDYARAYTESPKSKNVAMVEYLANKYDNHSDQKCKVYIFDKAGKYANTDVIQWLITNRPEERKNNRMLYLAVCKENLEVVRYILQLDSPLDSKSQGLYAHAAAKNNLEIMKLLHQYNIPKDTTSSSALVSLAVENNNLEMMIWVAETFTDALRYPKKLMETATKNNNLGMVKWLAENTSIQYPDNHQYCCNVMIKWIFENRVEIYPKGYSQQRYLQIKRWF
ncbi:hypothetical protein PPL_09786 [Heterostelium album PN500]|uniref:Ankyrin repeat protein n=1 Tax=Heterostelium pallidum (strain ATCC 26659 / Pp 5 / PN500) TaxID=670386 RepID=D3BP23_HETP5|nr:hypothetical protein PPL_09786 [Heterostelium album PN500]EFA77033.1 hypothetical protein PPL_09786 [Heterostelium album PN500]|eukprot:XP_020429163.1 hypothetical protein PPL_09786 [Heterostelium album PN500]